MGVLTAPSVPAARPATQEEQHLLLRDVSWQTYESIGQALAERPRLRLTYDRGNLEIMTLSRRHEILRDLFGFFIRLLILELRISHGSGGSMTFQRQDLERGLEPDGCFWFRNAAAVRRRMHLDFTRDPPPDLVIEIDLTSSWLDRMDLYTALAVSEVWRFDGTTLRVFLLELDGYRESSTSLAFPGLPLADLAQLMRQAETLDDETDVLVAFQTWIRQHAGSILPTP